MSDDVSGAGARGPQGEQEHHEAHFGVGMGCVGLDVVQHGAGVRGLAAGQQPFHHRLVRTDWPTAVGVHVAGGLRGNLGAVGLVVQGSVAGDVGPQGERAGLALVELGEEGEVGFSTSLIGAERVAEFDEFQA